MKGHSLPPVRVHGAAFFSPFYATLDHVLRGERREETAPEFPFVEGRLRRFTSLVTQMHLEVVGAALAQALVEPSSVMPVFGTGLGEIRTGIALEETIFSSKQVSAAQFTQSVHNTPSGIFSVAAKNLLPATAISAGESTFGMCLLEAALLVKETGRAVLLSMADESPPAFVGTTYQAPPLAVAFLVTPDEGGRGLATLRFSDEREAHPSRVALAPGLESSFVLPAVELAILIARGEGRLTLPRSNGRYAPIVSVERGG